MMNKRRLTKQRAGQLIDIQASADIFIRSLSDPAPVGRYNLYVRIVDGVHYAARKIRERKKKKKKKRQAKSEA
jgi:hypothetical protein